MDPILSSLGLDMWLSCVYLYLSSMGLDIDKVLSLFANRILVLEQWTKIRIWVILYDDWSSGFNAFTYVLVFVQAPCWCINKSAHQVGNWEQISLEVLLELKLKEWSKTNRCFIKITKYYHSHLTISLLMRNTDSTYSVHIHIFDLWPHFYFFFNFYYFVISTWSNWIYYILDCSYSIA